MISRITTQVDGDAKRRLGWRRRTGERTGEEEGVRAAAGEGGGRVGGAG
jgi:hypothetical protein